MILILGGITEGREVVGIAGEVGRPCYYLTKGGEQEISLQHGIRLVGALTQTTMRAFCRKSGIRLPMDTAYPFAEQLHAMITTVSQALGVPCARYECMYNDPFKLFNEKMYGKYPLKLREKYEKLSELFDEEGIHRVLAPTGVQSIPKLKPFRKKKESECYFRIFNRESSREIVWKADFPEDRLVYYTPDKGNLSELLRQLSPEVALLKESGVSGGFPEKVNIVTEQGIRLYILFRPSPPPYDQTVNRVNGIRCAIEHLLPDFLPLRSGLTTGTCTTAAVSIALWKLLSSVSGNRVEDVPILFSNGEEIAVPAHSVTDSFTDRCMEVSCIVVRDGGDDPDITNGLPIVATASIDISEEKPHTGGERQQVVQIHNGQGVGTVILPGLGLEAGGPVINTALRQVIIESLLHILDRHKPLSIAPIHATTSVPGGEEVATHTFSPRLGVVGDISIIGTGGIMKPLSFEAFVNSIRKEMPVAWVTSSPRIVINSGAESEKYIHSLYPELPSQAFIRYGNFIGETIRMAVELDIRRLALGVMIGKAIKLAEGHLDTHSKKVTMSKEFLKEIARQSRYNTATVTTIEGIMSARELWGLLPEAELQAFCSLLIGQCHHHCDPLPLDGELTILSIAEEGEAIH